MSQTLQEWILAAKPGDRAAYHVGHLAFDAEIGPTSETDEARKLAAHAYLTGWYDLTQARSDEGFVYYIIRRRNRDTDPHPWIVDTSKVTEAYLHRVETGKRAPRSQTGCSAYWASNAA